MFKILKRQTLETKPYIIFKLLNFLLDSKLLVLLLRTLKNNLFSFTIDVILRLTTRGLDLHPYNCKFCLQYPGFLYLSLDSSQSALLANSSLLLKKLTVTSRLQRPLDFRQWFPNLQHQPPSIQQCLEILEVANISTQRVNQLQNTPLSHTM